MQTMLAFIFSFKFNGGSTRAAAAPKRVVCAEYSAPGTFDRSRRRRLHSGILLNILPRVPLTACTDAGSIQVYCWIFCPGYRWLLLTTQILSRYIAEYSAPGTADCWDKRRLSGILLNILPRVPLTARSDADSIYFLSIYSTNTLAKNQIKNYSQSFSLFRGHWTLSAGRAYVYCLTLSHMAYFALFTIWPGVQ